MRPRPQTIEYGPCKMAMGFEPAKISEEEKEIVSGTDCGGKLK
jgi:hypothetical protein